MRSALSIYATASVVLASTVALSTLDLLLTAQLHELTDFATNRALLLAAFALNITAIGCVVYYTIIGTQQLRSKSIRIAWFDPSLGAGYNAIVMLMNGGALIWLMVLRNDSNRVRLELPLCALILWVATIISHAMFFILLSALSRKAINAMVESNTVTTYGIILPRSKELAYGTRPSFCSRDTTLICRPQSDTSSRTYSMMSSTTKAAASLRSKLARHSARSSLDLPPFPAGEATALGNAFDRYDSSQIDSETRNTILSTTSPSHLRTTHCLEPIPGSRPGSREDNIQRLPSSPSTSREAQGTAANARSNPFDTRCTSVASSTIPSSRASSRARPENSSPRVPVSMTDLIHPLFRPNSPTPPQIMSTNTMVTASPLANQPITPKSLERLRSKSDLRDRPSNAEPGSLMLSSKGQWRVMPNAEAVPNQTRSRSHSTRSCTRPSTSDSSTDDLTKLTRSETMGSPGPSIIEEEDLPPILPGFVLSAGTRSSLVGYGKRKSVKRDSSHLG